MNDMTMEVITGDGESSGPIPMSDLELVRQRMRATGEKIDKEVANMGSQKREPQLSLDVGGEAIGLSVIGTVKIGGDLRVEKDLDLGDEVRVQVVDSNGEIISSAAALISAPAFKEHRDKHGELICLERAHKAKIDG